MRVRRESIRRRQALHRAALIATIALSGCATTTPSPAPAPESSTAAADKADQGPIVDPDVARRQVTVPHIKSSDYESGVFFGVLSTQELEAALIYGARVSYHVNEDIFVEGEYGRSSVSDRVRREIGQPFFPKESIGLNTYGLDVGYNFLPGEVFFGSRRAFTSTFYLLAGVGDTSFNSEDYLTYSAGFGLKVLPSDHLAVRLEARDRIWQSDLLGSNQVTNNLEMTLGFSAYF